MANWITVTIGSFFISLTFGSCFTWGNLTTYATPWLQHRNKSNESLTTDTTFVVYSVGMAVFVCSLSVGTKLMQVIGGKITMIIGTVIMLLGVWCSQYVTNLPELAFTYGFMIGFGTGIMYSYPLKTAIQWNPKRKGLISGFFVSGLGFGCFTWNMLTTHYCNPDNEETDIGLIKPKIYNRVPDLFKILTACWAGVIIIGLLLLRETDVTNSSVMRTPSEERIDLIVEQLQIQDQQVFSFKLVLKNWKFWVLYFTFLVSSIPGTWTSGVYKDVGGHKISSDSTKSLIGSIGMLLNSFFQQIWGTMYDYQPTSVCLIIQLCLGSFTAAFWFLSQESGVLFGIIYVLICITYAGVIQSYIALSASNFGVHNTSQVFTMLESAEGVAMFIELFFSSGLKVFFLILQKWIGLKYVFVVIAIMVFCGTAILIFFKRHLLSNLIDKKSRKKITSTLMQAI